MLRQLKAIALSGSLLAASSTATATATLKSGHMFVYATQYAPCTVRKISDLAFGINDFAESKDLNETSGAGGHPGELDLHCGDSLTTIGFDHGSNFNGLFRRMSDGNGHYLSYVLCQNAATTLWNCLPWDGFLFRETLLKDRKANPSAIDHVFVHGIVPDIGFLNDARDANYSDTVNFTVVVNV